MKENQHDAHDIRFLTENLSRAFRTFGMVPNQTGSPTFNPGMYKVVVKGTPMFPKKGKTKKSPF
jgi:hypothetical protein